MTDTPIYLIIKRSAINFAGKPSDSDLTANGDFAEFREGILNGDNESAVLRFAVISMRLEDAGDLINASRCDGQRFFG